MEEEFNELISNKEYFNKYIEILFKYNNLNEKINKKNDIQKKASLKYFHNNKKNEHKNCDVCNCNVNITSFNTHLKSQKHIKNINLKNQIKDLQK